MMFARPRPIDVAEGATLPEEVVELLADRGLRGYNEVHDVGGSDGSSAGAVAGGERHQFVDLRTRGEYQSYVVD